MAYREEHGKFQSRKELLKVAKLGPKAFEQCAGFLKITDGKNPLDATSVHPESYEAAEKLLNSRDFQRKRSAEEDFRDFLKQSEMKRSWQKSLESEGSPSGYCKRTGETGQRSS